MITLAATIHDEHAGLSWLVRRHLPALLGLFDRIVVVATPVTDAALVRDLREAGCGVLRMRRNVVGLTYWNAVARGAATGADTVFYCDFDRVLHWEHRFPQELRRAVRLATRRAYVVFGRSPRAYRTHHEALSVTERLPNTVIAAAMGETRRRDYLAGCFSFSKKAARVIASRGKRTGYELFGDWPLLLSRRGFAPVYRTCEGLEWETPDRFREEVRRAGGVRKWRATLSSPAEWRKRALMAEGFLRDIV